MPLESIQLDSSNKTYAIREKKYTPFTCFWGALYWNWIIFVIVDPQYLKLSLVVALWSFFQISQVWPDLDSSRKSYVQSPTMTQLWTSSIQRNCMNFHVSLFSPLAPKLIDKKIHSVYLQPLFTEFQSDAQRESYEGFPMITSLRWNSGAWKILNFHRSYENIVNQALKFCDDVPQDFGFAL